MAFSAFGELVARYNSTLPTLTDGAFSVLQVDSNGRAFVVNSGTFAVQESGSALTALQLIDNLVLLEDSAHVSGDSGVQMLSVRSDTLAQKTSADGDYAPLQTNASGALYIVATGTTVVGDGGGSLTVDGTVSVDNITTSVTPGTGAAHLGKAEDAVHATGDTGVMSLAVRKDTAAALAGADGDYIPLITDASGKLWVNIGGQTVSVDSITTSVTPGTGASHLGKAEDAAHTSGDVGVMSLAVRKDTAGALAGTDGDYAPLQVDANGALRVSGSFTAAVDDVFESGTEADTASDSGNTGDGTVAITGSMTDLVSLAVGAGTTAYIVGWDVHCDREAEAEVAVFDGATLVETIRKAATTGSSPNFAQTFPRAIEIAGAATRAIKIRAKALNGTAAEAAAGLNVYTR